MARYVINEEKNGFDKLDDISHSKVEHLEVYVVWSISHNRILVHGMPFVMQSWMLYWNIIQNGYYKSMDYYQLLKDKNLMDKDKMLYYSNIIEEMWREVDALELET